VKQSNDNIDNSSGKSNDAGYDGEDHHSLQQRRLKTQVDIILSELEGAVVYPPEESAEMEYVYRDGRILVRDVDLPRVQEVVGGRVVEPLINGVSALAPGDDFNTQTALQAIDAALGINIGHPDHAVWIVPASACPATEPNPVPHPNPDPAVRRDRCCDGTGAFVSVVDTGYIAALADPQHGWLAGVTGDPEAYDPNDIGPYVGHGTFVAGVLRCMAPGADVRVEGFLTHGGAIYESEIVQQLNDSLDDMPDIISMSAGCTTRNNLPLLGFQVLWEQRLQYLKGTAVVVAAGNDRSRKPFWPAAFPWAVSVGALERDGSRARFSNFGSWVDVYALGGNVVNAYPNGTYRYREPPESDNGKVAQFVNAMSEWSGTSFSTPLVAGIIAARMSHTGESGRQAADAVLRIARSHAEPGIGAIAEPGMACDPDPGCGCRD